MLAGCGYKNPDMLRLPSSLRVKSTNQRISRSGDIVRFRAPLTAGRLCDNASAVRRSRRELSKRKGNKLPVAIFRGASSSLLYRIQELERVIFSDHPMQIFHRVACHRTCDLTAVEPDGSSSRPLGNVDHLFYHGTANTDKSRDGVKEMPDMRKVVNISDGM